jgi:hypothetical protein
VLSSKDSSSKQLQKAMPCVGGGLKRITRAHKENGVVQQLVEEGQWEQWEDKVIVAGQQLA